MGPGPGFALSLVLLAARASSMGAGSAPGFQVRISHEATAGAVRRSLAGAYKRLARPRCQEIFSAFRDLAGRRLQEALDERGLTGPAYLQMVTFDNGSRHPRCALQRNLAVASPGIATVHVCPEQFRSAARHDPALAEYILIHETLHSLGLGENPPSSQEITSHVAKQCR